MRRLALALLLCVVASARAKILLLSGDPVLQRRLSEMFDVQTSVSLPLSQFSAVVLDTAEPLPFDTRTALDQYVRSGGGLAITGAASTAYPEWPEYNIMLGVTGFEGRDSKWGPLWFYENEKLVSRDVPGPAGWAAPQSSPFQVKLRAPGHAAMQGLPRGWTQLGGRSVLRRFCVIRETICWLCSQLPKKPYFTVTWVKFSLVTGSSTFSTSILISR